MRYEILVLTIPTVTEDEVKSIKSGIEEIIVTQEGTVLSFERWGKYRLAYPVNKNDYGIYFLVRFELDKKGPNFVETFKELFAVKLREEVMRHLITCLDADQSLVYQRPLSLEETPPRDESGFNKGKIEKVLFASDSRRSYKHKDKITRDTSIERREVDSEQQTETGEA